MTNNKNYWTTPSTDGSWRVVREGAERATSVHETQTAAWKETQERARETKGEAYLQNREGQIRERNTYGPDPRKTKG